MSNLQRRNEAAALVVLEQARLTGKRIESVPSDLAASLASNRLASVDEFGDLHITERGQHHLRGLKTLGVVRSPRSALSRRR